MAMKSAAVVGAKWDRCGNAVVKRLLAPTLSAGVTLVILLLVLRDGIVISPDGWAYWQGSVSILDDQGYRYFDGRPIIWWPPLYSIYLAAWQWWLGVSGRSLVISTVFLAAVATFSWTAFHASEARNYSLARAMASGLIVSTVISATHYLVLANHLIIAGFPVVLFLGNKVWSEPSASAVVRQSFLIGMLTGAFLLAHNSSIAIVPPLFLLLCLLRQKWLTRLTSVALACFLPVLAWLTVRYFLGQVDSHPFGGARYGPGDYFLQLLDGVSLFAGFRQLGLPLNGFLLFIALAVAVASGRWFPLLFAAAFMVCLLGLFNATYISDPFGSRFSLCLTLSILPRVAWYETDSRLSRWACMVLVVYLVAINCVRTAFYARSLAEAEYPWFVTNSMSVSPSVQDQPIERGGVLIVPPRRFDLSIPRH
jgi:hypothetical protein